MKVGIQVSSFTWPGGDSAIGPTLAAIGRAADGLGFDSFWVMDHLFQIPVIGDAGEPMLEGYSALSFLAGLTERITLGALVTSAVYRPPGLLAKAVTTLDVLSGGRAWLGIGAAWFEREAAGLGLEFPPLAERFERLDETLQIVRRMWEGDRTPFRGRHFSLAEPINSPQALSRPHPRILIGGGGEKRTLRLVAQHADACNLFALDGPGALPGKLDVLKRHCDALGRPYEEIERTALAIADLERESPASLIERCRSLAAAGIQHVILGVAGDHTIRPLEVIGREVIPALAGL